jgi:hypothetical protein
LFLEDAIEMTGALNFDEAPIGPDFFQGRDVEPPDRITIADDHLDRHRDRFHLVFSQRQLARAARAEAAHVRPDLRQNAARAQPSHAAERSGQGSIGVLGDELQRDHPAHRVADDVRLLDFQMVEQKHNVFDPSLAVGRGIRRLVRFAVARQIECDDPMIFCERVDRSGRLPVDAGAGTSPCIRTTGSPVPSSR